MTTFPKPEKGTARRARGTAQRSRAERERDEKAKVRARDGVCRFPWCSCAAPGTWHPFWFQPHVSHLTHKGMGGNPSGDRSKANRMILLCGWRHQYGRVSIHAGTVRIEPLTAAGTTGPVAVLVDRGAVLQAKHGDWVEFAREASPGVLEAPTLDQVLICAKLAGMVR